MGDVYMDMPVDRHRIHQTKMAKLQQDIAAVEQRMQENVALRKQLENISDAEQERTQRVINRMNSRNMVLKDEIDRIYQSKSPVASPSPTQLVSDVITRRTKEFSDQQHEKAMQYKYLMAEKQRLQVAQEQLRAKRLALHRLPTPEAPMTKAKVSPKQDDGDRRVPPPRNLESAHSNASVTHHAAMDLPYAVERIWQLKEDLRHDYETKQKPYRGELGIDSYEAWQMEDYVWIQKFVEDFLDSFVSKHIAPDYSYVEQDVRWAMRMTDDEEWQRTAGALSERKAVQLVGEAILLQETRALMRQTAAEVLHVYGTFKNMTDLLMMREAESISTGAEEGRDAEDPAYNLITKSFFTAQQNRSKFRKDVWSHTQYLHLTSPTKAVQEPIDDVDADVELITHGHLHPADLQKFKAGHFDLPPARRKLECAVRYRKREPEFWTDMEPGLFTIELPDVCEGVQCMRPSPDGFFMAVGTVHGDVLVYDVRLEPWRLGRVAYHADPGDDSTVDVAWSLDATKLVSVSESGRLQVWGVEGPAVNKRDARVLQLEQDEHGNVAKQLGRIGVLDVNNKDLMFQLGPLAESEVLTERFNPVRASFFPTFSLFGVQHVVCSVLENGDIMRINLEPLSTGEADGGEMTFPEAPLIYQPNIYDESHGVNLIGQNLEAELFRQHQHPIMYMGYMDNISRMVTVDDNGYINIWHYDTTFISGFGYFIPEKKYKLDFNKKMYTPSASDKPKVIFTDSAKTNTKSQAEIAKDRNRIQHQLDNMNLGDPWHEELVPERNLVTSVYAPKGGVKDSGAMFNIVLRHETTQQLSTYLTRMYRPVTVKCTKLLAVEPTPSGGELVFILLFPEYPPKEPHMMVLILDLMTMKLRDLQRDIYLSSEEHDKLVDRPVISFSTTRVLAPTGAEYLFILMEGRIRCVSLTTGNLVLRAEDPKHPSGFTGCTIDEKYLPATRSAEVTSVCCNGNIYTAIHDKATTTVQVLQLKDGNEYEGRRLMWKAFQTWDKFRRVPPEVRVDKVTWLLSDMQHAEVDMRRLILDLVDEKVFGIQEGEDEEADSQWAMRDKTEQYNALMLMVEKKALLEGPHKSSNG